jgi:hypothetical protein
VYEQRLLHRSLGIGLVVGLATCVGGYLLKSSVTTEPLGLVADLVYALGYALWTGVVVVVFAQVFPEVKRRQFKQVLDAYGAGQRDQAEPEATRRRGITERRPRVSGGSQRRTVRRRLASRPVVAGSATLPHRGTAGDRPEGR